MAVAVGGALLLVLTGVVCYAFVVRRQASKRALFRAVKPPGAGPATTLVMTDVQVRRGGCGAALGLPTRLTQTTVFTTLLRGWC